MRTRMSRRTCSRRLTGSACRSSLEAWLASGQTDVYRRSREQLDRLVILRVLQEVGGNRQRAAEILGLSKVTLRAKLRSMGLSVDKVVVEHPDEDPAS